MIVILRAVGPSFACEQTMYGYMPKISAVRAGTVARRYTCVAPIDVVEIYDIDRGRNRHLHRHLIRASMSYCISTQKTVINIINCSTFEVLKC